MKIINWFSVLSVLCISTASCTNAPVPAPPAADVEAPLKRFLAFYFHAYKRGHPEKSQLPEHASFLAPDLLNLVDAAMRGEDCYATKNNNEGSLGEEEDLFSSLIEGATSAAYHSVVQKTDKATFEIEWTNDGRGTSSPPFVWKDQVFLVRTTNGWLIYDFAHLGTWDFMMKGNVSEILRDVAKECAA